MYRIIGKRGTGKTKKLLMKAKETNAIVVCKDPTRMVEKAYHYGITGLNFLTYLDFMNRGIHFHGKFLIDDMDAFVATALTNNIIGYTLSED